MMILKMLKGFVTNSSSANYWLNDGILEEGEEDIDTSGNTASEKYLEKYNNVIGGKDSALSQNLADFGLWAIFSFILIIVFAIRKISKQK